ncbi:MULTISPECIES: DUF1631 domain-containing protein [Stenotrophomonas]|uniref:DUF1631 domain-containing protein n=1 Tax=Stenotrophomonas TaxID=40323 RepID=UPI0009EA5DA3|nr:MULTISPECIES: DUF1631 domain-containing protein [Stenotrophomonas]
MSGTAPRSSSQAMARIAATQAPARVRHLLEIAFLATDEVLRTPLQLTAIDLERALFKQAEMAHNSQIQSDIYAQLRVLRDHAEQLPDFFLDALAAQVAAFKEAPKATPEAHAAAFKAMTLVEDTDIDRDIVLHEMARREAFRTTNPLLLLGQRFAVLAAQPAFDPERLPVGPYALCRALRDCGEQMQFNLDTQLALYQVFERLVMPRHGELLDRLNILLEREGVLPGLVYRPHLPRPSAPRGTGTVAGQADGGSAGPRAAGNAPLTSWQGQAPAASWASISNELQGAATPAPVQAGRATAQMAGVAATMAPMESLHSLLDAARNALAMGAGGAAGAAAGGTHAGPATGAPAGTAMPDFAALQAQAQAGGAPASPPTARNAAGPAPEPVSTQTAMDVLGKLQAAASSPGSRHGMADIRNALIAQVKAEHGPAATLSARDGDTMDLLGMLYSELQREVRSEGPAADLLRRLQVPLARAAISDHEFFLRDQHPARELLNAVAESGAVWLSDDDSDPVLLLKLKDAVNKVVTDYQGDETVFVEANDIIQGHLRAAARRAEMAERRQVDAARGKERLEAAKQLANGTIDALCQSSEPPKFVQTLLRKAWADVLTLTLLRHGEGSDEWQQREQATRRIGEITGLAPGGAADTSFGEEIEQSLLQVGYHQDEAAAISRRLSTPGGEDAITSRTELAAKLKTRARLGESGEPEEEERRRKAEPARSEQEEAHYRQLRTLPFGTWFEFIVNQQGDNRRQRLSWYSLITGNALFVNQRGQKVSEHSLDAMSRLMAKGQLRIVTEDRGRLIDRAWQATVRALRSIAGGQATNAGESA